MFNALRLVAVWVYIVGAFYIGYNNGGSAASQFAGSFLEFAAGGIVNPGNGFAVCKGYGSGQVEVVKSFANYV